MQASSLPAVARAIDRVDRYRLCAELADAYAHADMPLDKFEDLADRCNQVSFEILHVQEMDHRLPLEACAFDDGAGDQFVFLCETAVTGVGELSFSQNHQLFEDTSFRNFPEVKGRFIQVADNGHIQIQGLEILGQCSLIEIRQRVTFD